MRTYFKKIALSSLIISFFPFGQIAFAEEIPIDSSCVATAITSAIAANVAAEELASLPTGAGQGLVETLSVTAVGAAGATAVGLSPMIVNDVASNAKLSAASIRDSAVQTYAHVTKMNLDMAAYSVAHCALNAITDNTVNWIKGGFNGSPKFAVDTTKLFQDLSDAVLEDFSNQIKNIQACDFTPNFVMDLANSVETSAPRNNKFPQKIQCPFNAINVSAQVVYNDFRVLGWRGFEMMLEDNGNQFGVSVLTAQEAERRKQETIKKEDQKLAWSSGFADIIDTNNCPTMPQEIRDAIAISQSNQPVDMSGNLALTPEAVAFYQKSYCMTTTPGKIIGDSLMKSVGLKQDRIGFADNMNKIIAALLDQLTKETITGIFDYANSSTSAGGSSSNTAGRTVGGSGATLINSVFYLTTGASSITQNGATLVGSISYTGIPGSAWFEWGPSLSLANSTPKYSYTVGADSAYSTTISGLNPNTTYYFRAVGQSSQGLLPGDIMRFTTTQ